MASEKEIFEKMPVNKSILTLALPAVAGQIILVIYNMADTFFVGLTGNDVMISTVTVCMPAFMFLSAIANLFGVGGASLISRSLGDRNREKAKKTAAFALLGCVVVSALYSLFTVLCRDSFVNFLGGTEQQVHGLACVYITCTVAIGGMATALAALFSHLLRSEGRSLQASIGIAMGGILNIGLDPLFMFVILPEGNEVLGAAIATALSNLISLVYFIVLLLRNREHTVLKFRPTRGMFGSGIPGGVFSAGLPACLMTLCENISFAVLDRFMAVSGIAAQAGMGVAKKVNMLAHCTARGVAQGVLPLIGYNYASGNHRRMYSAMMRSTIMAVVLAGLWMGVCIAFDKALIGVFIHGQADSALYGEKFLRILCLGAPFSACAYTCITFFQATGKGTKAVLLALFRKGILDIPLMFVLNRAVPLFGSVWATPITDLVCCILAVVLFARFMIRHTDLKQSAGTCESSRETRKTVKRGILNKARGMIGNAFSQISSN